MNQFSTLKFWLLCLAWLCTTPLYAQTGTWANVPAAVCPGEQTALVLQVPSTITSVDNNTLSGCSLVSSPTLNKNNNTVSITVRWANAVDFGTVKLSMTNTVNGSALPVNSPEARVGIRNVFGRQPGLINNASTVNIPICASGAVTFSVAQGYYTGVPNEAIVDYLWEIPTTWAVSGAGPLNTPGLTPRTGYYYYLRGTSITATPAAGEGNTSIQVRYYSRYCNETPAFNNPGFSLVSSYQLLNIQRQPTLAISGLPASLTCGITTPFNVSAALDQAVDRASWQWTLGPGWTGTNLNTATPTLTPTGQGGITGQITARLTYYCGAQGPFSTARTLNIPVSSSVAPVTLAAIAPSCPGQTVRLRVNPVPGATSYVWQVPAPFSPAGTLTTPASQTFLDITSPSTIRGQLFTVRVEAHNDAQGCTASSSQQTGQVGGGTETRIEASTTTSQTEVCANQPVALTGFVSNPRNNVSYTFTWTVTVRSGSTGRNLSTYTANGQNINVTTPNTGDWLDIRLDVPTDCGSLPPAFQSWQAVQSINGNYCLDYGPDFAARTPAYPNPATEQVVLPPGKATYRLRNSKGEVVRETGAGRANGPTRTLDVRALPAGLYYLQSQDEAGHYIRQTLEIKH